MYKVELTVIMSVEAMDVVEAKKIALAVCQDSALFDRVVVETVDESDGEWEDKW